MLPDGSLKSLHIIEDYLGCGSILSYEYLKGVLSTNTIININPKP